MQTRHHEKTGLPSFDERAALLGENWLVPEEKQSRIDHPINRIKTFSAKANIAKLGPIGFSKKGNSLEIVSFAPKGGETKMFKKVSLHKNQSTRH